jgi:hypothetical protein
MSLSDDELDMLRGKYDLAYRNWSDVYRRGVIRRANASPSERLEIECDKHSLEEDNLYFKMDTYRTALKTELKYLEKQKKQTRFKFQPRIMLFLAVMMFIIGAAVVRMYHAG